MIFLERYKCIAAGGDYFEGDKSFSKSAHTKKVWKLLVCTSYLRILYGSKSLLLVCLFFFFFFPRVLKPFGIAMNKYNIYGFI